MAFCFECGDRLDDDLSSCSSCGWDKKQLEDEKYSLKSKKRLEQILQSFGFNKELFLQNPLDD